MQLSEVEAAFQAIVDPYAKADFFLAAGPEGAEVEEGYITFTTLPGRLLLKAGKMRAQFGKVNTLHTHALPRTDRPLVTRNLVGGEEGLGDAGISLSQLVLNPLVLPRADRRSLLAGAPRCSRAASARSSRMSGACAAYRDLTEGTNIDIGTSFALRQHRDRARHDRRSWSASTRRSATGRCAARSTAAQRAHRAHLEPAGPRQTTQRSRAFGLYGAPNISSPGAGSAAPRTIGPAARSTATRSTPAARSPHLLADRVQPGARPVPPHSISPRASRPTSSSSSSISRSAHTARTCSKVEGAGMRLLVAAHRRSAVGSRRARRRASAGAQGRHHDRRSGVARRAKSAATGSAVEALARGYQDPHFVEPKPSFILKLARADLLIARRPRAGDRLAAAAHAPEPQREDPAGRARLSRCVAEREDPRDSHRPDHPRDGRRAPAGQPALLARSRQRPAHRQGDRRRN